MATQQVPTIQVNIPKVRNKELQEQGLEADKRLAKAQAVSDSFDGIEKGGFAKAAEGSPPPSSKESAHDNVKKAFTQLRAKLAAAGESENGKNLEERATARLTTLDQKIADLEGGGKSQEAAHLQKIQADLFSALQDYRAAHFSETEPVNPPVAAVGESADSGTVWTQLRQEFKTLGIDTEGEDIESLQAKFVQKVRGDVEDLKTQKSALTDRVQELQQKIKIASPEEKKALEAQLTQLKEQLNLVAQKTQGLQHSLSTIGALIDNALRLQIASDLGIQDPRKDRRKILKADSKGEKKQSSGNGIVKAQSAGKSTPHPGPLPQGERGSDPSLLKISSPSMGEDQGGGEGVDSAGVVGLASNDFSGTTLSIQAVGSNLKQQSKETDKLIKKLLQAAVAGNWDSVKDALIFLDKRANQIIAGIGAQTIKAMQSYEKQMSQLSGTLGKLKGTEPDYNAKLAKINSDMNMYSMNRQAITNFLRDTMTMREEIGNLTHSVLGADERLISAIARF